MVVLYNRLGESLQVGDETWREILATASQHGWQPSGTSRPPIRFDLEIPNQPSAWESNYDHPQGQTVSRSDAVSMGKAISLAFAGESGRHMRGLAEVGRFCGQGSFLICDGSASEEVTTTEQLVSLARAAGQSVTVVDSPFLTAPTRSYR